MGTFSQQQKQAIARAALDLACKQGWRQATLPQLAKKAKIPLAQLQKNLTSVNNVLPILVDTISQQVFKSCSKPDHDADRHDALFEIFMTRFDVLQKNRKAILSMTEVVRREPKTLIILLKAEIQAMQNTLSFVSGDGENASDRMKSVGLLGVFLVSLKVWQSDETLDMSKTMSTLDRCLRFAGRAATLLHK